MAIHQPLTSTKVSDGCSGCSGCWLIMNGGRCSELTRMAEGELSITPESQALSTLFRLLATNFGWILVSVSRLNSSLISDDSRAKFKRKMAGWIGYLASRSRNGRLWFSTRRSVWKFIQTNFHRRKFLIEEIVLNRVQIVHYRCQRIERFRFRLHKCVWVWLVCDRLVCLFVCSALVF